LVFLGLTLLAFGDFRWPVLGISMHGTLFGQTALADYLDPRGAITFVLGWLSDRISWRLEWFQIGR
jgi:hypothetical protein